MLALAQAGVVWNRAAIDLPLVTDAACPQILELEDTTADVFYGCGLHAAWRLDPLSLWEASGGGPTTQQVAQGLLVSSWCAARAGCGPTPADVTGRRIVRRRSSRDDGGQDTPATVTPARSQGRS